MPEPRSTPGEGENVWAGSSAAVSLPGVLRKSLIKFAFWLVLPSVFVDTVSGCGRAARCRFLGVEGAGAGVLAPCLLSMGEPMDTDK